MLDYDCNAADLNIDVMLAKTADNALRFIFITEPCEAKNSWCAEKNYRRMSCYFAY